MASWKLFYLLISLSLINCGGTLKILQMIPGASDSHVHFDYKFARMLYEYGHNVTLLTMVMPFGNKLSEPNPPENIEEIRFTPRLNEDDKLDEFMESVFKPHELSKLPKMFQAFRSICTKVCHQLVEEDELLASLRAQNFDMVFAHFFTQCPIGIAKTLNVPKFLWVVPGTFIIDTPVRVLSLPNIASYIPYYTSEYSDRMTFMERVKNFATNLLITVLSTVLPTLDDLETEAFRKFPNQNFPHLNRLAETSVQALLLNGEDFLDFPRPLFTNVLHMGDLKPKQGKALNEEWQTFMENSIDGVIIFSLGTIANTSSMPMELKEAFLKAFIQFPTYSIVWRLEGEMPKDLKNYSHIKIVKWLPQVDLLHHPKCKLFITHGGYNSLLESVQANVPMILIPLFGDQYGNVKRAVRHGLGLSLDRLVYDSSVITETIKEVLFERRYSDNAKKFSSVLQDKIIPSDNLTVHIIEKIARVKKWPLVTAPHKLNYLQYYCVDVVLFHLGLSIIFVYVFVKLLKVIITRYFCRA